MTTAAQDEFDRIQRSQVQSSSTHPEDADSSAGSASDTDDATLHSDAPTLASQASTAMPSRTYEIPSSTYFDANTGPKGVIADARSFDIAKKRSFRQTLHAFSEPLFNRVSKREKSSSPELSADEEEDDFMRSWRAKRLDELASMKQDIRTRRQSPSKRKYGAMTTVDPIGYLDAVEKVGAETVVLVMIYDDEVILPLRLLIHLESWEPPLTTPAVRSQQHNRRCPTHSGPQAHHDAVCEIAFPRSRNGRGGSSWHLGLQGWRVLREFGVDYGGDACWPGRECFEPGERVEAVSYSERRALARRGARGVPLIML